MQTRLGKTEGLDQVNILCLSSHPSLLVCLPRGEEEDDAATNDPRTCQLNCPCGPILVTRPLLSTNTLSYTAPCCRLKLRLEWT